MNIPLVDLRAQMAGIRKEVQAAIDGVLDSCKFINGPHLKEFEEGFASYCGASRCVGVSNGTSALFLALEALGVGEGDEVITTPLTFIATAESIRATGAEVVLADIDPEDLLLSPEAVRRAVTGRTRAIVAVHLYGQPADMGVLGFLAREHGLALVEDAAQSHGATFGGRRAGSLGDIAAFSFFPGKNLGTVGDGGAVVTSREDLAGRVAMFRDHGRRPTAKYEHEIDGFNYRLSEINCAVLRVKLAHLDRWTELRARWAGLYDEGIEDLPVGRVLQRGDRESSHHLYVVRVRGRDRVLEALKRDGIGAGIHYPIPLHLQPALSDLGKGPGSYPNAEDAAREILSLPLYPELGVESIARVVDCLRTAVAADPH